MQRTYTWDVPNQRPSQPTDLRQVMRKARRYVKGHDLTVVNGQWKHPHLSAFGARKLLRAILEKVEFDREIDVRGPNHLLFSVTRVRPNPYEDPFRDVVYSSARIDAGVDYCLAPGTRVLRTDMTWEAIEKLQVGDELVGFDESLGRDNVVAGNRNVSGALMAPAVVLGVKRLMRPGVRITTERGSVVASIEHRWVARPTHKSPKGRPSGPFRWVESGDLDGCEIGFAVEPWEIDYTYDGAYMAGLLDGEGWARMNRIGTKRNGGAGVAQKRGVVLDEMRRILTETGVRFTERESSSGVISLETKGKWQTLRMLGMFRPRRLVPRMQGFWEGASLSGITSPPARVLSVEPLGEIEVIAVETSTRTFIAEGFFSHNCGNGPVHPIGKAKITHKGTPSHDATFGSDMSVYQLLEGPAKGKYVFFAEHYDNAKGWKTGKIVNTSDVLYHMNGCIEIGWSDGRGSMAWDLDSSIEGQRTVWGQNMSDLLESLGAKPGLVLGRKLTMRLPAGWPTW